MTPNDVDLVIQPSAADVGFITQPSVAGSRLTFQHFANSDPLTALVAPHNSDARQSNSDDWPPPLIFDVAYGCAALNTWGAPIFMDFARTRTRHVYYDNGEDGRYSKQKIDRDARAARRAAKWAKDSGQQAGSTADSEAPDIADIVLSLWMHNARKVQRQVQTMKADKTREKVGKWLNSVN